MRSTFVYGVVIVGVVCASVSCGGDPSSVPPLNSSAQRQVAPAASTTSDCDANAEQLPLKIFYAPKEEALEPAVKEYSADIDDHAEQVWRLEHFKVVDDTFITGTLTEGSAHRPAFDDGKQRFYRKSQWRCQ
jgi:hypothetical protein